mmetsp:Transcript_69977/g.200546  ORF Transcript_69977/g.200546 Transcript_69977/m.200546 type:complete len:470 (-) Transcript_69977:835-2244(-)
MPNGHLLRHGKSSAVRALGPIQAYIEVARLRLLVTLRPEVEFHGRAPEVHRDVVSWQLSAGKPNVLVEFGALDEPESAIRLVRGDCAHASAQGTRGTSLVGVLRTFRQLQHFYVLRLALAVGREADVELAEGIVQFQTHKISRPIDEVLKTEVHVVHKNSIFDGPQKAVARVGAIVFDATKHILVDAREWGDLQGLLIAISVKIQSEEDFGVCHNILLQRLTAPLTAGRNILERESAISGEACAGDDTGVSGVVPAQDPPMQPRALRRELRELRRLPSAARTAAAATIATAATCAADAEAAAVAATGAAADAATGAAARGLLEVRESTRPNQTRVLGMPAPRRGAPRPVLHSPPPRQVDPRSLNAVLLGHAVLVVLLQHPLHGHQVSIAQDHSSDGLLPILWPIGPYLELSCRAQGQGDDRDVPELALEQHLIVRVPADGHASVHVEVQVARIGPVALVRNATHAHHNR